MLMTKPQREFIAVLVENDMMESARTLANVNAKLNPGLANDARQRFRLAAATLAIINADDAPLPYDVDQRALDPRCVHGVRFAEPCPLCPLPDNDLGSSN